MQKNSLKEIFIEEIFRIIGMPIGFVGSFLLASLTGINLLWLSCILILVVLILIFIVYKKESYFKLVIAAFLLGIIIGIIAQILFTVGGWELV